MARSKQEIYEAMIAAKENDEVLSGVLTSSSKAAFFRALFYLFAESAGDFEQIYDNFVSEVTTLLNTKRMHNANWWQEMSFAYQYGYSLSVMENGNLGYTEEVEDAQIIKRAAVTVDALGVIVLKVAGETDGVASALSELQQSAFKAYTGDIAPAGIVVTVISSNGDLVDLVMSVEVDTQVINPDDGSYYTDSSTKPVEAAVLAFIDDFQENNFGGVLYANKILSAVLGVEGVENATLNELTATGYGSEEIDILSETGRKYYTYSGYLVANSITIAYSDGD